MAEKKVSEMSLEELKSKESKLKVVVPLLIVVVILLAAAGTFLTISMGFGVFTIIPIVFIGIVVSFASNLKKIRAEISER